MGSKYSLITLGYHLFIPPVPTSDTGLYIFEYLNFWMSVVLRFCILLKFCTGLIFWIFVLIGYSHLIVHFWIFLLNTWGSINLNKPSKAKYLLKIQPTQKQCLGVFFKNDIVKDFVKFKGKHMFWSPFLIKLRAFAKFLRTLFLLNICNGCFCT